MPEIITNILTVLAALYIFIKTVKDLLENADWYNGRLKKQAKKRQKRRCEEIKQIVDDSIKEQVNPTLNQLIDCNNDLLRTQMKKIYYEFVKYKKIPEMDKQDFDHMFNSYTSNSFIADINSQVETWEVVPDKSYIKEKEKSKI